MILSILLGWLASVSGGAADCGTGPELMARVRTERVTGSLAKAEAEVRLLLECQDLDGDTRRDLQIELARLLDRVGLHQNTRPVAESLELLRQAERALEADDTRGQAAVALALAEYHYRAEMDERRFPLASEYARRAEVLFRELGDPVGETDAVHRLGLVELQKRNLQDARTLFDHSLELSRRGPERLIFLSDYHRHVGFVDRLSGDQPAAITHFERSLAYRNEAGSRDYALFARTTLGSALVGGGRPTEARPHLEEALETARDLPSPVGALRATYALGKMHEASGDAAEARRSYRHAREMAVDLGATGLQTAAQEGLERLERPD